MVDLREGHHRAQGQPHCMYDFKLSYTTMCPKSNNTHNSMDDHLHQHLSTGIYIAIIYKTTWYFKANCD